MFLPNELDVLARRSRKYCFQLSGRASTCKAFSERDDVGATESFGDVQASDFGDGDSVRIASERFHFIAGAYFSFARDGEVETGAGAGEKAFDHVVGLKADAEFVARKARLGDDDLGGADGELVAEMD